MNDAPPDLSGTCAGEYLILRTLGVGGMGVVYEGRQPVIGKRVAIKILLPALSKNAELVARFVAEARAVNAIGHRGIIDIFSFGQLDDGSHYFVMELLEGRDLDAVLRQHRRIPVATALEWSMQVLDALAAAHQVGVIHRDLKPSNLFLAESRGKRWVKLLDFGIAKLGPLAGGSTPQTQASMIIGTPSYMAPEQVTGKAVTPAADLYSMGCVLFELVTGKRAFDAANPMELMFKHVEEAPPIPSHLVPGLPSEFDELVLALLEKDPARRPRSATDAHGWVGELRARLADDVVGFPPAPATASGEALSAPLDGERPPMDPTQATRPKSKLTPPTVPREEGLEPTDPSSRRSARQGRECATPNRSATPVGERGRAELAPARSGARASRTKPVPERVVRAEPARTWWAGLVVLLLGLLGASAWIVVDRPEPVRVVTSPSLPRAPEPRVEQLPLTTTAREREPEARLQAARLGLDPERVEPTRSSAVESLVRVRAAERLSERAPVLPSPPKLAPRNRRSTSSPAITPAKLVLRLEGVQAKLTSLEAASEPDHVLRRLLAEAKAQVERAQTTAEVDEAWSSLAELDAQLDQAFAR